MKIDKSTVDYIAKLAKLSLTDEKSEKMAKEFEAILTHFQSLNNADLDDVKIDYKDNIKPVFRKDETSVFEDKKKLFQNAKSLEGSSIKVPKIIE
ncbi:MAG: Asp-tRNA(Asn)/Glu-tRNA(Gln) amidotransferase subunit GatC [Clostridiaceae bacterium]